MPVLVPVSFLAKLANDCASIREQPDVHIKDDKEPNRRSYVMGQPISNKFLRRGDF